MESKVDPKSQTTPVAQGRSRVVLADDHADVLKEIGYLLEPEFDVVCSVCDGGALFPTVLELRPDIVVSDIHMPLMNGIEAGRQILQAKLCESVVILTMYNEPLLVRRALEAGIRGYVLKVDAGEELIPAMHAALSGRQYLSRGVLTHWNG